MLKRIGSTLLALCIIICGIRIAAVPITVLAADIPDDAVEFGGNKYKVIDTGMNWFDAKDICESMGGHLVIINSESEQLFIESLINNSSKTGYWLGGNRESGSDKYYWLDGTLVSDGDYTNWGYSQPDITSGTENSMMIYVYNNPYTSGNGFGKWNDIPASGTDMYVPSNFGYICEWENSTLKATSNGTSSEAPIINSVRINYDGSEYECFTNTLNIGSKSTKTADITFDVDWNGATDTKIALVQNEDKILTSDSDSISGITLADIFSEDMPIYAVAYDLSTNKSSSRIINLRIGKENSLNWAEGSSELKFKIGRDSKVTIPSDVPVFGDMEIGLDMDFIPISVEVDNNKARIVYGKKVSQNASTKKFTDFSFDKFKKDLQKAASKQGRTLKQLKNDHKMSDITWKTLKNVSGNVEVMGYAEGIFAENGNFILNEGLFQIESKISYKHENSVFVGTFPIYYEVSGNFGAGIEGNVVNVDINNGLSPEFQAAINAKLEVMIGGGVGVAKVATVGASGTGAFNAKWSLNDGYTKYDVTAKAEFKIKIFGKEVANKKLAEGSFLIYETGNPNGLISDSSANTASLSLNSVNSVNLASNSASLNDVDVNKAYENESRAYAENGAQWFGDTPQMQLFSANYSAVSTRALALNVYPDTEPIIRDVDGTRVMVWLEDAVDRTDSNKTMVVYSVYDAETDLWSEPKAVYDDGTADFYPYFNDGWVVWQNSKGLISDNATLKEIGADTEIYAAKFNGTDFDSAIALTDNSVLDTIPVVAAKGSKAAFVWVSNDANDVLMNSGNTSILTKTYDGSSLSSAEVLYECDLPVIDLDCTFYNDELYAAYINDSDKDYETTSDRDITVINSSGKSAVTADENINSNPIFSGNRLFWYSSGNINYVELPDLTNIMSVASDEIAGLNDQFTVDTNSNGNAVILWSMLENEAAEVNALMYNNGEWSLPVKLANNGVLADCPFGYIDENSNISAVYVSRADNTEEAERDLCLMELVPSYDISIEEAYIDGEDIAKGTITTANVVVKNNGQKTLNGFTLNIFDTNGESVNSENYENVLKAGETAEVLINYTPTGNETKGSINVTATIAEDEGNIDNNTYGIEYGSVDICVENVTNYEILPENHILADISNISGESASNIVVSLKEDSAEGAVIASQSISSLAAGESKSVAFDVAPLNLDFEHSAKALYVVAEIDVQEVNTYNNYDYALIYKYSANSDYNSIISGQSFNSNTNTLKINTVVANNLNRDITLYNFVDVKDLNGNVVKRVMHTIDMTPCFDIGDDFEIKLPSGYNEENIAVEAYALENNAYEDVDFDNDFDNADAELLLKYVSGIVDKAEVNYNFSDYNADGKTDILDVISILRKL